MLHNKHILLGISGGIAAYKIPELIRLLTKAGADVRVTTTHNALEFVTETTLRTLSGHTIYSDVFAAVNAHATEHISLPDWADMMLIAPATVNVLGKLANGIADDALTTTFAAMRKPVVIAPAMNDKMYAAPATQQAMQDLAARDNITMLDCAEGPLACGTSGKGRMQEIEVLLEEIYTVFTPKTLLGKRVMITAGPTIEKLDPVRYISNFSTGKMGRALAQECRRRGAEVTLIMGAMSAQEMCEQAVAAFAHADIAILAAAVADYRPKQMVDHKIKKQVGASSLTLMLVENPDIAATLGKMKQPGQQLIGFALETNNELENAQAKLQKKNLDMIVLNSLNDPGAGFGYDTNKVTLIHRDGTQKNYPLLSKEVVAGVILDNISLS
ncbi:MAG: bifunctional phosphopantothenoylcysteine decarboxylase/phosphopantothenate--cysteine ligase CoaBC [Paludibacteraceae bacterium]|nr:bifunctional phosphopantothenoylcysteine decarboxylase/phosphopantothenate--cysteine ligase CoaBC [Paludibacteraceae bacterium]